MPGHPLRRLATIVVASLTVAAGCRHNYIRPLAPQEADVVRNAIFVGNSGKALLPRVNAAAVELDAAGFDRYLETLMAAIRSDRRSLDATSGKSVRRVLIRVHGGMKTLNSSLNATLAMRKAINEDAAAGYYPVFINWNSSLQTTRARRHGAQLRDHAHWAQHGCDRGERDGADSARSPVAEHRLYGAGVDGARVRGRRVAAPAARHAGAVLRTHAPPLVGAAETNAFKLAPWGSLLEWIDRCFARPEVEMDRMMGRWDNLVRVAVIPEDVRGRVHIKGFGYNDGTGCGPGGKLPHRHGDFNDRSVPYWRPVFWHPGAVGCEVARAGGRAAGRR